MIQSPMASALRDRFLITRSGSKVLELHPHLSLGEPGLVHFKQVHVAGTDALAGDDFAVGVKAAVVARAAEALAVAGDVDEASGVGADDVPRSHDLLAV